MPRSGFQSGRTEWNKRRIEDMRHALYELYDSLTMLISPTLEAAFDRVELLSAERSSRRLEDRQAGSGEQAILWGSEAEFDEARIGKVSA